MSLAWFPIAVLGVWRITHLLVAEDGPFDIAVRLRRAAGAGPIGAALDCFYCLSVWTAVPLAIVTGGNWLERVKVHGRDADSLSHVPHLLRVEPFRIRVQPSAPP